MSNDDDVVDVDDLDTMIGHLFTNDDVSLDEHDGRLQWLWECTSTQNLLYKWWQIHSQNFSTEKNFALLAHRQTQGVGQRGKSWISDEGSLLLSFTLTPHPTMTLTPLEIGVLTAQFFETQCSTYFKLPPNNNINNNKIFLKWPNDLLNYKGEKLGGILCQATHHKVIVGLGINLFPHGNFANNQNFKPAFICPKMTHINSMENLKNFKIELTQKLISFIAKNRMQNFSLLNTAWTQKCLHLNSNVAIICHHPHDDPREPRRIKGKFLGITEWGEALVEDLDHHIFKATEASLEMLDRFGN